MHLKTRILFVKFQAAKEDVSTKVVHESQKDHSEGFAVPGPNDEKKDVITVGGRIEGVEKAKKILEAQDQITDSVDIDTNWYHPLTGRPLGPPLQIIHFVAYVSRPSNCFLLSYQKGDV